MLLIRYLMLICIVFSLSTVLACSPPPTQVAPPKIWLTVNMTTVSQIPVIGPDGVAKMLVGENLQITVNSPDFKPLYSYISDNTVLKQTGREGEVLTPPGHGVNYVFIFQALVEGTTDVSVGVSPQSLSAKYQVNVIKTYLTPDSPKYNVKFIAPSGDIGIPWVAVLGVQESPATKADYVVFAGVPNGWYQWRENSQGPGRGTDWGSLIVNGADVSVP